MKKWNVSLDLLVPALVEIEAETAEDAADAACEMDKTKLLSLANTEAAAIGIDYESITVDEVVYR